VSAHEAALVAFLAGDLDREAARDFDNHLLGCESCWTALREDRAARAALERLRDTAPAGLADRVRLAVELQTSPRRHRARPWKVVTGLAGLIAAGLVAIALTVLPSGSSSPPSVATVVHFARLIPSSPRPLAGHPASVPLGRPIALSSGGQPIELVYYRVGDTEALVATSPQQFSMPSYGHPLGGSPGMAWTATRSGISLLCLNGPRSTLLAATVPLGQLNALAAQLHLH
jgi:putative zinc finger protein